jgi:putative ABC transport system permease protein
LSGIIANTLARQRVPLGRAVVLLGVALAFALSTSAFDTTYAAQAEVDARLSNGADVTVTESPGVEVAPSVADTIAGLPGVHHVEPLQHRFAYVGTDLQDLYGVRPASITTMAAVEDTYFQGGTARQLMDQLATQPDSVLVSAETVQDFQLRPGDLINLRLRDGRTGRLLTVPFHYRGIVTEFPTAPKDSFLVANADYIARQTGSSSIGAFLVDTGGTGTTAVADRVRALLGPSARVSDIADVRATIGSTLTAVDLSGLTRIELAFGLLLALGAAALVLATGLTERRRGFAIAVALGAKPRRLRPFVLVEAGLLIIGGVAAGALIGVPLAHLLVAEMKGAFDPPPSRLSIPWLYLAGTGVAIVAAIAVVCAVILRAARRSPIRQLREL